MWINDLTYCLSLFGSVLWHVSGRLQQLGMEWVEQRRILPLLPTLKNLSSDRYQSWKTYIYRHLFRVSLPNAYAPIHI